MNADSAVAAAAAAAAAAANATADNAAAATAAAAAAASGRDLSYGITKNSQLTIVENCGGQELPWTRIDEF